MVHHSWASSTDSTTILQMVVESVLFSELFCYDMLNLSFSAMIFWSNWWFQPPWKIWKSDWIIIPTIGEVIKFHGSKPPTSDGWEAMIRILPWHSLAFNPGSSWYPRDFNSWIQVDTIPVFFHQFSHPAHPTELSKDPQQVKTISYRFPTWWITEKASPEYPHYTPKLPSRVNVFSSGTGKSPSWSSVNEA